MTEHSRLVVWAPSAEQDLIEAWRYYARMLAPDIADTLINGIRNMSEQFDQEATTTRVRDDVMPGLRSATVSPPYVMFYRVTETRVEIARVVHGRRFSAVDFGKPEE